MLRFSIPVRLKLFLGFFIIIVMSVFAGVQSYKLMQSTSKLVYTTYDNTLMSGQFAQSAKFNYSEFDSNLKMALITIKPDLINTYYESALESLDTLESDLDVVWERSLSEQKEELVGNVRRNILEVRENLKTIIGKKLKSPRQQSSILNNWEEMNKENELYDNLNILFDDAAELGYIFRLESEEKNNKNLELLKYIGILNFALSILLSLFLSYIVIRPLNKLDEVCKTVDSGDYSVRSSLKNRDEFGKLARSFNLMLNTIEQKDTSMETLLKALPYGVFYFEKDGSLSKERSSATDILFPQYSNYNSISEFFNEFEDDSESIMSLVLSAYEDILPFDSITNLLPQKIIREHAENKIQILELRYREARNEVGELERIIIIARDITELEQAKKDREKLIDKITAIEFAIENKDGFYQMLREAEVYFKMFYQSQKKLAEKFDKDILEDYQRDLHSFKGMSSLYKLNGLSKLIHQIESSLHEDQLTNTIHLIEDSQKYFNEQTQEILSVIGHESENEHYQLVNKNIYNELKAAVKVKGDQISELVNSLNKFPIELVTKRYKDFIQSLVAENKYKKVKFHAISKEDRSLDIFNEIDASIIHLLKNSFDHGIESEGEIKMELEKNEKELKLMISDNGKGIDYEKIKKIAISKGLIDENYSQSLEDILFMPGFSSKTEVSLLSGRGVGMSAVKEELEALNGSIKIETKLNQGTKYIIKLPKEFLS